MIIGLLGLQISGGIYAIILASGDDSVAVVPDYHQKALQWDEEMAVRRTSIELGWKCDVSTISISTDHVSTGLVATLLDDQGQLVKVQKGKLRWYQHIRANDVAELPIPKGLFTQMRLEDCFDANGLWEVILDVTDQSGNRFVESVTLHVEGLASTEAT